ncbi:BON domain-containing protein [Caballeronia sp. LjRoot34]|uniref:hypothetical protein n=1 Tax=Caballeronia sp. LjRoot34 TaxID=3342325 RepID=UPI003ED0EF94
MKTDKRIKWVVEQEIEWDPAVNATGIGVAVRDRIVTLAGHWADTAKSSRLKTA